MTPGTDCLLAHDVGTSATKTSVVGSDGRILASQSTPHETRSPNPGWAEQDAGDWWDGVCRNTRALVERDPALGRRIAAIGVSGHMLGCLPLDADGRPLRPSMIHSDGRASAERDEVERRVGGEMLYQTTGNILDPHSPLCKILWLKENEPDVYRRTARFVQSKDYVVGCMVGRFDSTDYSDASHAQWIDINRGAYAEHVLGELGIDADKFPRLYSGVDVVGELTDEAAPALGLQSGIPVVAGGGDGSCATAGAGAVRPADAYCCIGTTAWVALTAEDPMIDPQGRIFNLTSLDGQTCGVFGTVKSAGLSVDWMMDLLGEGDFERFDALLAEAPPGSDDLIFLPYLEGERSPIYDSDARGVFFGINSSHRRHHFLRATIEGVSYGLRSCLDVMRETIQVPALRLIGGGGQSQAWQQILADVCAVNVQTLTTRAADATSVGAALAAGVGVGIFDSLAEAAETIGVVKERPPRAESAETYERLFDIYMALYPALKPLYRRLQGGKI